MALRAVSIVNLETSIRAQFDRQYDEIHRNLRAQERRRSSQTPQRGENDDNSTEDPNNNNSATTPTTRSPSPDDMTENGDLGRSDGLNVPRQSPRIGSVDISVECPDFPSSPDLPELDDVSDSLDLDREIDELRGGDTRRDMTCCQFYRSHWIGHLVTGIISGFLFVLLGVIFLVNNKQFPVYAGITLILLGLAPCCMALNRYRYMRLYDRERRRAVRRLGALRRLHRRNVRESRRHEYPDLPPAYDNLGYDLSGEDFEIRIEDSRRSSFVLPSYDQCVKKKSGTKTKEPIQTMDERDVTNVNDVIAEHLNTNNNNDTEVYPPPEQTQINRQSDIHIEIIPPDDADEFEIIDPPEDDSIASSSGDENTDSILSGDDNVSNELQIESEVVTRL